MKKYTYALIIAMVVGFMMTPLLAQTKKKSKWSTEVGLSAETLNDQKLGGGIKAKNFIDLNGTGFRLEGLYQINENFKVGIGVNRVTFAEDSDIIPFNLDDIEAMAHYTSVRYSQRKDAMEVYGLLEVGLSKLEGTNLHAPGFGKIKLYDGTTDLYYAAGVGINCHFNHSWYAGLAYRFKSYGSLEADSTTSNVKDLDITVNSLEMSLGYKF